MYGNATSLTLTTEKQAAKKYTYKFLSFIASPHIFPLDVEIHTNMNEIWPLLLVLNGKAIIFDGVFYSPIAVVVYRFLSACCN